MILCLPEILVFNRFSRIYRSERASSAEICEIPSSASSAKGSFWSSLWNAFSSLLVISPLVYRINSESLLLLFFFFIFLFKTKFQIPFTILKITLHLLFINAEIYRDLAIALALKVKLPDTYLLLILQFFNTISKSLVHSMIIFINRMQIVTCFHKISRISCPFLVF